MSLKKIISIVGPTASGKTDLSLHIAKKYSGYIISADSKQVYVDMDIGTGKITPEEQKGIPHFGLDIVSPDQEFNVSHFKAYAESIINSQKKLPVIVGGTGLFIDTIIHNITPPEVEPDPAFREKVENDIEDKGLESVVQELLLLDPESKNVVDLKNPRRVIRALEVCVKTGESFSSFYIKGPKKYNSLVFGIDIPKEELHAKIDTRIDAMINKGLVEETKKLIEMYEPALLKKEGDMNATPTVPALLSVGYRQVIPHLHSLISKEQAIEDIKIATKQYAKRQMTWFRKNKEIVWIQDEKEISSSIDTFLEK